MAQEEVTFKVLSDSYATFISTLRGKLPGPNADMVGPNPEKGKQRPVLAKQTSADKPPPRWIHVELEGKGGVAKPKVAIRSDNVYIVAFTNVEGKWFELIANGKKGVIPGATPLGFDGHYTTLVGGIDNLPTLKLGKFTTSGAAVTLWNHTQKSKDNDELKKAVATLCVVLSEAARFAPVYNVVNSGWSKDAGVSITGRVVKNYIKNWGDLSKALLGWKRDDYKNDAKWFKNLASAGIDTGEKALAVVELLLNNPPPLSLLAWLKHLWGLLVNGGEVPTKSSAIINPL